MTSAEGLHWLAPKPTLGVVTCTADYPSKELLFFQGVEEMRSIVTVSH